jgi:Protein of unknown function (DUF3800)
LLRAYFDESGTHQESKITALAGFVGTEATWTTLEPKWQAILDQFADKGVRWFHMSEALAQRGQFAHLDKVRLNYIITQLGNILEASGAVPLFSAVVTDDWDVVVGGEADFLAQFPKPLDLCFANLVQHLARWTRERAGGEMVAPMFAYSPEYSARLADLGRVYGSMPYYKSVLGPIAFDYPERVIPLQCADLLVHQINWDIENRAYGPFNLASMGQTVILNKATAGQFVRGNWFDADGLKITLKRFRETGAI